MSTLTACMHVHNLHASVLGGQKVSHSLEMELQMVASHHDQALSAGNSTQTVAKAECALSYCTISLDLINLFILLHI